MSGRTVDLRMLDVAGAGHERVAGIERRNVSR